MKTTIQQQIIAIQNARTLINQMRPKNNYDLIRLIEIVTDGLNDAGSTLAAINLNPEIKKLIDTNGQ